MDLELLSNSLTFECQYPQPPQGHPYDITVTMYDTPDACCAQELPWIDTNECINETQMGGYPQQWFRESLVGHIAPFRHPDEVDGEGE